MSQFRRMRCGWLLSILLVLVLGLSACNSARPGPAASTATPAPAAAGIQSPASTGQPGVQPPTAAATTTLTLTDLPALFHYEVTLHPANAPDTGDTKITGEYSNGAWHQTTRTSASSADNVTPAQESVTTEGVTYTRPVDDSAWTKWPGVSFDTAYGLTSPFTILRLYALADQKTKGELSPVPGAPDPTFRTQVALSGDKIKLVFQAGAAQLAPTAEMQNTLVEQVAPLAVPQSITYWATETGQVYRAAATLVTSDPDGQITPWMEVTWRFWGYGDSAIAVAVPASFRDAPGPSATDQALPTSVPAAADTTGVNLNVNVFAAPGVPAQDLAVTVYPAGDNRQPIDWRTEAAAGFTLPPGRYDVLVQMDYAQEWLRNVEVKAGSATSRDVTFDFGTLQISVMRGGKPVTADIVTYPAGNRQNWVDWTSDNPANVRLRAGSYDVEIAYDDYNSHKTVSGLVIKAGQTTTQTVTVP